MKNYANLFDFSFVNHCFSSEIYHCSSKHWKTDNNKRKFSKYISNSLDKIWYSKFSEGINFRINKEKENLLLKNVFNLSYINNDFALSRELLTNNILLNQIFACKDLKELSSTLHLTELQTKFILKNIQSKVSHLLQKDNS